MAVVLCNLVLFLRVGMRLLGKCLGVVIGIFLAVNGRAMSRILIEVGSANSEFFAVRVDPLPQLLSCGPALRAGIALDADHVGGEFVTVTAAQAAAVV